MVDGEGYDNNDDYDGDDGEDDDDDVEEAGDDVDVEEEDDDVEKDVEEEDRSQDWEAHFVQSTCTRTFHKSHFVRKFTGKMPDAPGTTSIEHRALTFTVRTPQCGHTVWGNIQERQ